MAWHRSAVNVTSDINVTPLVDVMLVLLIIFMVITPMMQHGFNVKLAQASNSTPQADADKDDAILVAVSHDGRLYFGNDMVSADQVTNDVRDALSNRTDDKAVFIKADAAAQFSAVTSLVDAVRDGGADTIVLETTKVDKVDLPPSARGE